MLNEELEQRVKSRTAELEKEIIQRKEAEERLIRQQEFSRALLESMADGVVACDAEGVLALFNRAAKEWHGMDPMRLPPEEWAEHYDLFRSDGITALSTDEIPLARAFKGETFVDAGMAIAAKGQAARFILANGSVIRDECGNNLGAVVVMRDVTELRRVEEALRKANEELESAVAARTAALGKTLERLKAEIEERKRVEETLEKERNRMDVILSALNIGLSLINPDMTIAWVNQKIREMFPGREPVGQVCHLFYESRSTICDGCGTVRAFMDGKVCESEQLVPATGRWYYIISQPIKDTTGCVVNVLEGITDITAHRQAEKELYRLTLFQRTILDNASYGIISTTPEGIITSFNPAVERLLGYTADEMVGKQTPACWHDPEEVTRYALRLSAELGETITPGFEVFAARARRNLPEENEWTFICKDGRHIPINLSVTALRDEEGHITGFVGMGYDLTERKRAEEALYRLNEELEQRVRERTKELERRNRELEQMNKVFVDRELRMVELKERIRELEKAKDSAPD